MSKILFPLTLILFTLSSANPAQTAPYVPGSQSSMIKPPMFNPCIWEGCDPEPEEPEPTPSPAPTPTPTPEAEEPITDDDGGNLNTNPPVQNPTGGNVDTTGPSPTAFTNTGGCSLQSLASPLGTFWSCFLILGLAGIALRKKLKKH